LEHWVCIPLTKNDDSKLEPLVYMEVSSKAGLDLKLKSWGKPAATNDDLVRLVDGPALLPIQDVSLHAPEAEDDGRTGELALTGCTTSTVAKIIQSGGCVVMACEGNGKLCIMLVAAFLATGRRHHELISHPSHATSSAHRCWPQPLLAQSEECVHGPFGW